MFKYNLAEKVFILHKNKIVEGKVIGRTIVENLLPSHKSEGTYSFIDNAGITYAILITSKYYTGEYKEDCVFKNIESCVDYITS